MNDDRRTLLDRNYVKVDVVGDKVEIYTLSGEFITISKDDLHQICKNYLSTELDNVRAGKRLDSLT